MCANIMSPRCVFMPAYNNFGVYNFEYTSFAFQIKKQQVRPDVIAHPN